MTLAWTYSRFELLSTLRTPIAVIATAIFPAMSLLFFVVPQSAIAQNPVAATSATTQLLVFSAMTTALFSFGSGVAEDRATPWYPYLRTLPTGPMPGILGRIFAAVPFSLVGLVPLTLVAAILTAATITPSQALIGVVALMVSSVPFMLMGFAIGYSMSAKAAIAVVQVVMFVLAFAGGLFMPPQSFPNWLDQISVWLPSRAARDVMVSVVTDGEVPVLAIGVWAGWVVLLGLLAVAAFKRDEGRRFR